MIQLRKYILMLFFLFANGCSYLMTSATDTFANNLKYAILNHNDPQIVADAIPAYLLLQEALLVQSPDNEGLLMSTANLYSSYSNLSEKLSQQRKQLISQKAFDLALNAACLHKQDFCHLNKQSFDDFTQIIENSKAEDLDILYGLGTKWIGWIQANSSDWNAIAQLAQVKYIMHYVVTVQDNYKQGEAYLYSAVMESLVPPALGGKADIAKYDFEKALQLSNHKNLMVYVLYAKHYARMMFDRELHDSLLNKVINAQVKQNGLTLSNTLAQQKAKKLLQSADDYF
ncbi:MAG: TRAP transporter TatT component family protein [Methylococcales bacterium]